VTSRAEAVLPSPATKVPAKIITMQAELLHPADSEKSKLLSVKVIKYGNAVEITAVAANGASFDEVLEEVEALLAARHHHHVTLNGGS
jgi:hypothetical protein